MKKNYALLFLVCLFINVQVFGQVNLQLEGECANIMHRTFLDNAHRGYTGAGFADFKNEHGSYAQFNVNLPQAGTYTLSVKYANGSADRTMNIYINDVLIKSQLNFPSTGRWNAWNTLSFSVNLNTTNRIRFVSSNSGGGPNIDHILLKNAGVIGNFKPVAVNDTITVTANQQIAIPVDYNDFDLNGTQLTITGVSTAVNGTVSLLSNNYIRYIPKSNFEGKDAFTYTVSDGVHQATGTVVVYTKSMDWSVEFANMIVETKTPATIGSWDYTVGLLLEGMLRVYKRTGDTRYLNFVDEWAKIHVSETGVIDDHISSLDNMMPGFTLLHLYQITKNQRYKLAVDKIRANYTNYPRTSDGGLWHHKNNNGELWLDGLYMSTPFIATYGLMFNDEDWCYQEVITQYKTYIKHLKNSQTGILVHAYDEDGSAPWALSPSNRSPHHWGRSIGWVMMGLMEVIDIIPENYPDKTSIIDIYTSVLKELIKYQDKNTGLWYQMVDKGSDDRNWQETSCTMMFALGMKRAIENGYLPDSYNQYADLAYSGVLSKVSLDENNRAKLTDVCMGTNVSSSANYYYDRTRATNDKHGVGTFMILNEYFVHNNLPWPKNDTEHNSGKPLNLAYSKVLLYQDEMKYNPTDEFIFPYVIKATDHIANPLGKYYLYYAPHDAPGGICLAYSNNVNGPFTEYANNPILSRNHQGKFNVTHVSSPQVVWMPQYNKYFMYFHGENTTTRWAHSTDGINWVLANDNIAINTSMWANAFGSGFTECSYAKVFDYAIPGIGDRYTMVMMLIKSGHGRRIGLATSNDGKKFTPRDPALITSDATEGGQLGAPFYWSNGGKHYIIYHGASGKIHYTEVGSGFNQEIHKGVFYNPGTSYPEYNKAADCFLIYDNNRWNMFYTVGTRLEQTIAYAFEVPSTNFIIDNASSGFSSGGSWVNSISTEGYFGPNYLHDNNSGTNPGTWAKWKPTFPVSGYYKVLVRWPSYSNRPSDIKYKVYHQGNVTEVRKNQQEENGSWIYLGKYYFDAGNSENNRLTLDAGSDDGYTVADAAWFILDNATVTETLEQSEITTSTLASEETSLLAVFPNPAEDMINLASLQDLTGADVSVIDAMGMEVINLTNVNSDRLDISSLKAGIYTIIVSKDGSQVSTTFVKK